MCIECGFGFGEILGGCDCGGKGGGGGGGVVFLDFLPFFFSVLFLMF